MNSERPLLLLGFPFLVVALSCSSVVQGSGEDSTPHGEADGLGGGGGEPNPVGGASGTGGSGETDDSGAGGTDSSGGAGGSGSTQMSTIEVGLAVPATDLGDGTVRLSYDFADQSQLSDWVPGAPNPPNEHMLVNEALLVDSSVAGQSGLKVVELGRHLRVTYLAFDARLEEGDHVNAYFNLINDGSWDPESGIGLIHRSDGVRVVQGGVLGNPLAFSPVPVSGGPSTTTWHHYEFRIEGEEMTVALDDNTANVAVGSFFPTSRALALGSYESVVSFDNVVIQGELH